MKANRDFLRCDHWQNFEDIETDQSLEIPRPDVQKPYPEDAELIDLVPPDKLTIGDTPLKEVVGSRKSQRLYSDEPITIEELSFMLWATQGIREVISSDDIKYYYRTIPSGGNRHALETYLSVHNVTSLDPGLYRYLPLEHKLVVIRKDSQIAEQVSQATFDQTSSDNGQDFHFVRDSAVTFIWSTIPYRMEWRYHLASHKMIAIEAGHACQNLYLSCGAVGAGACAIGAFDRSAMDDVLGLDGGDESVYMLPQLGKYLGNNYVFLFIITYRSSGSSFFEKFKFKSSLCKGE
jgi:SagB-type dehydrogenase family enzyme